MNIRVCSGFSPAGYNQYGKKFLDKFNQFWPRHVDLMVYAEEPTEMPRGECRNLNLCNGIEKFISENRKIKLHCGRQPRAGWRDSEIRNGYCYKFDAVKFCRQLFIPEDAARDMKDDDILVWLDADVMTLHHVPDSFVPELLGDHDLVYLGRDGVHSEIGFWAIRLNRQTRDFIMSLAEIFRSGQVFELNEWHSAFVFDHCRRTAKMDERNLTPGGRAHVWLRSPLDKYMDHLKGNRKVYGYSPGRQHRR